MEGTVHRYEKLLWKREAALESWSLKIERHLSEVRNVWTFVSNHFEGFAPETCQRLAPTSRVRSAAAFRNRENFIRAGAIAARSSVVVADAVARAAVGTAAKILFRLLRKYGCNFSGMRIEPSAC